MEKIYRSCQAVQITAITFVTSFIHQDLSLHIENEISRRTYNMTKGEEAFCLLTPSKPKINQ
jgi:hypothetical protein